MREGTTLLPPAKKPDVKGPAVGAKLKIKAAIRNASPRLVVGVLLAAAAAVVCLFLFFELKGNIG